MGGEAFHLECKGPLQGSALLKAGKGRGHRTHGVFPQGTVLYFIAFYKTNVNSWWPHIQAPKLGINYYLHVTKEAASPERLSDPPKVIQAVSGSQK